MRNVKWPGVSELIALSKSAADETFFNLIGELQCAVDRAIESQLRRITESPELSRLSQSWKDLSALVDRCPVEMANFAGDEVETADAVIRDLALSRPLHTRGGRPFGLLAMGRGLPRVDWAVVGAVEQAPEIAGEIAAGATAQPYRFLRETWLAARTNVALRRRPRPFQSVTEVLKFARKQFGNGVSVAATADGFEIQFPRGEKFALLHEPRGLGHEPVARAVGPRADGIQSLVDAVASNRREPSTDEPPIEAGVAVSMRARFIVLTEIGSIRATRRGAVWFSLFRGGAISSRPGYSVQQTDQGSLVRITGRRIDGLVLHVSAGQPAPAIDTEAARIGETLSRHLSAACTVTRTRRAAAAGQQVGRWRLGQTGGESVDGFSIEIGPLGIKPFYRLWLGGVRFRRMVRLIRRQTRLAWRMKLVLAGSATNGWRLGIDRLCVLGKPGGEVSVPIGGRS